MAGYIGDIPVPQATQTRQSFTATASQTSFPTIGYTAGFIDVYLNGIKLVSGTDFTASNGSDVVLTTGAAVNDVLDVVIFDTFDTSSGNFNNSTFTSSTLKSNVTLKNDTEQDTDGGRASKIIYQGEQSGGEISTLAEIQASHDGTADDEKGDLIFRTNDGSDGTSPTERMRIDSGGNIGVNINAPSSMLHLFDGGTDTGITLQSKVQASATSSITFMSRDSSNVNQNAVLKNINGRLQSSAGIMFGSDTAADNALDDYEEGAWVPTIKHEADTNLSVGYASAFTHGRYVKIGTIVYFQFTVSLTSVSGGASNQQLIINNMPFTAKTYQTNANGGAFMHYQSNLNTFFTYGIMLGNATNLRFYSAPNTPSYGNTLTSSSHFQGYGQYETAS